MNCMDLAGHACCVRPLERHEFSGQDFLCDVCGRPRALHLEDGFVPSTAPSRCPRAGIEISGGPFSYETTIHH